MSQLSWATAGVQSRSAGIELPRPEQNARNLLHLVLVLCLWLSTVTPLLPAAPALPAAADRVLRELPAQAARATSDVPPPYRSREQAELAQAAAAQVAAPAPAAANAPLLPFAPATSAPVTLDAPAAPAGAAPAGAAQAMLQSAPQSAPVSGALLPTWLDAPAQSSSPANAATAAALLPTWAADAIGVDLHAAAANPAAAPASIALAPAWATAAPDAASLQSFPGSTGGSGGPSASNFGPLFGTGICTLPGLDIATSAPPLLNQGDATTPYTFTLIITNTDYVTPTGLLSVTVQVPPKFYFVGGSASATSGISGALRVDQPFVNTSAGVTVPIFLSASPVSATLPPGDVITLTYRLAANAGGAPNPTVNQSLAFGEAGTACTAAVAVNTSYCPLAVRLPMQLTIPPYVVSFGNTAGDLYTVTVRNTGTDAATDVSFAVSPSAGFFFKGGSATAQSSAYGPLTLDQPISDTNAGDSFILRVADAYPANSLAPGEVITAVMRLGTDAWAKSGQPLSVTLRSGVEPAQACNGTRENVPTGRGNLVIAKDPEVQPARLGDVVTWTVRVRNTGLGSVYDAVFTDTPDSGIQVLNITPTQTTIPELKPDQSASYTVTGHVQACEGLANNAASSWSIGNIDSTGLFTNPVTDDAYVRYLFEDPNVSVAIQPPADLEFCGQPDQTLQVTVTNSGGPARELTLQAQKSGAFNLSTATPGWLQSSSVFSYTVDEGIIKAGAVVTMALQVHFTGKICAANSGSIVLQPVYRQACPTDDPPERGTAGQVSLQSPSAPSLDVVKQASTDVAEPGDTVFYTVTVSGRNPISTAIGPVHITDTLPPIFNGGTVLRSDSADPTLQPAGQLLQTVITPTTTPNYTVKLFAQATIPTSGACGGGAPQINRASASAASCPGCLIDNDYHILYVEDPAPGGGSGGYFRLSSSKVDVCGDTPTQQTVGISITNGITWTGSIYHDGFNIGGGVGPLNLVDGSVQVLVDGIDRTADVTVTTSPTVGMHVLFDNIGAFSATALITVTYQVTAGETAAPGDDAYFVSFTQGGYTDLQTCGVVRYTPAFVHIQRAAINNLSVQPSTLDACTTNNVAINVNGNYLDTQLTDHLVVTFTADAADVLTLTEPALVLGGGFAGQPVSVATTTVGSSQIVSFTFDPSFDIQQPGSIKFPLFRKCGVETPLHSTLSYADQCRATKTTQADGGLETRQTNLLLRASPITYTVDSRTLGWTFGVRNAGDMSATNVLITNTLPFGVHYFQLGRSGVDQGILDAIQITTGTVNPGGPNEREVVSFTVPTFPANSTIQFTGQGTVDTCLASDSLWIRLTQPCGGVNNACGGSQMARFGVKQGRGALLTSNTQQATIPLCSAGDVRFIVKNASGASDLYNFSLREVLTDVTYVDGTAQVQLIRGDGTVSPFVPFTPTTISPANPLPPYLQTLQWDYAQMTEYPPDLRALLASRGPSDQLIVKFGVHTYCSATSPQAQANAAAVNACGVPYVAAENSKAVEVTKPTLGLQKQVKNVTQNGAYAAKTYAGVGDTLVWKVDVGNSSSVDVGALFVTDTLPAWFNVTDVYTTPTTQAPPIVQWTVITGAGLESPVPAQGSTTFWITGTVSSSACTGSGQNTAAASYGCTAIDMCPTPTYTGQATVDTSPNFSVDVPDQTLDQCTSGPLTVRFANAGARSGNVVVTYTLPVGFVYDGLAAATNPMPDVQPALGVTGTLVFGYNEMAQQQVTNTLSISVTRDPLAPGSCLATGTAQAKLGYTDTCGAWHGGATQDTGKLTVQRPNLTKLSQEPVSQTVMVGGVYSWTLAVPNTGSGPTSNLVVTDTLDPGWQLVTVTVDSAFSTTVSPVTATVGGRTVITMPVGALPAGKTLSATIIARALGGQSGYDLRAQVSQGCDDDNCRTSAAVTSYNTPLESFGKSVSRDKVSIAEPFSYTIAANFAGGVAYTSTELVDVLPTIAGKLVFSWTYIVIEHTGATAWSPDTSKTGVITITPALGRVTGPDFVNVTVTGIISNELAAQRGEVFTNTADLAYLDAGQFYTYMAAAPAQVKEPTLGISKQATPTAGIKAGTTVTYTLVVTHAAGSDATAYNVVVTDVVPAALTYDPASLLVSAPAPGVVTSDAVGNSLVVTVSEVPTPSAPVYITYSATINQLAQPTSTYTNTAYVRYTSQPGENPNDRDGSGVGPNDYFDRNGSAITTTTPAIAKALLYNGDFTIGDLITYTVLVTLPTGTTRNLAITETIPAGLLYLQPTSTVEVTATPPITLAYGLTPSTGSGTSGSTAILRMLAPINNSTGATATLTWTLQLLVVNDPARTVNYNGAVKPNSVVATYVNADDQVKSMTAASANARIYEPLLSIGKSYVTAAACSAQLFIDNFNDNNLSDWTIANGVWSPANGWVRAPGTASARLIHGPDQWTDFSYSAVFSSTSASGDMGLIFRAQDAGNYYRFVWARGSGGSGSYSIVKTTAGVDGAPLKTMDLGASGGYTLNRWYHVEVRALGNTFTVFIDGSPAISYTDSSGSPLVSGSVGFYANNQTSAFFDDVLVTKIGDAGCDVSSNQFVTYTLTISNQERITGSDLVITDVLPGLSMEMVDYAMQSSDPAAAVVAAPAPGATGALVWKVSQLAPSQPFDPLSHSWLVITVTARVLGDVSAGVRMLNQALITYDGQPDSGTQGVQRTYSGGSHSTSIRTPGAAVLKAGTPPTVTIGQGLRYTVTLPGLGGMPATLYTATMTDALPSGFRLLGAPQVTWNPPSALTAADVTTTRSTTKTVYVDFTRIPSATEVNVVLDAVVENTAGNQDGVVYANQASLGWRDLGGATVDPVNSNIVTTTVLEPQLIVEKLVAPTSVKPGDVVFYRVLVYHAATSTVPAYNVAITDVVPPELRYISGSWSRNNEPVAVAATGTYTEVGSQLQATFPMLDTALTKANPLIITFQAVVDVGSSLGTLITNTATTAWTSLPDNPYGERRDGSGGVNDYITSSSVPVSLDSFALHKTGPLTVTAGSIITYYVTFSNQSAVTGSSAIVRDYMPFQVAPITATFGAPLRQGDCGVPVTLGGRGLFTCQVGDLPPYSSAFITLTARLNPATPDGALIDNYARGTVIDSNGTLQTFNDEAQTQVETTADLGIKKTGPATATAGSTITYTLVVSNSGPSLAHGVDVKDALPPGVSYVSGTSTQGACVSAICQLGDLSAGGSVTMVVTGTVAPGISGLITNTGYIFAATTDSNPANNSSSVSTTVTASTALRVAKTDFTDPAYAGSTYFYQIVVTNTGPATALRVVLTDTLPAQAQFEGASPGCTSASGKVICQAGDLLPGAWNSFLINVLVPATITNGTVVNNVVAATTDTPVLTATSVLSAAEPTTWLQPSGSPIDLAIAKFAAPAQVTAGAGAPITFTLRITNNGPGVASAVQVSDLYPRQLTLTGIQTSKALTQAQCSSGGTCDLGQMQVNEAAIITLTMLAPANTPAGVYTNTAYAGSPAPDSNPANNTASAAVTVTTAVGLQIAKAAAPNPAVPGTRLLYTIIVTNTGPSDASNATISDVLPAGFTAASIVSSQGGCASLPCKLGTLPAGGRAWVTVDGMVGSGVTQTTQVSNTARITATEDLVGATATAAPSLATSADVAVTKLASPAAAPGDSVRYTITVQNLGPATAQTVRLTDTLPAEVTLNSVAGCTNLGAGSQVLCDLGALTAGASKQIVLATTLIADAEPGLSIENVVSVTTLTSDPNLLNNLAAADTNVRGKATLALSKRQVSPAGMVNAGELVTYTVVVTNTGPGQARSVDVKDQLPPGLALEQIQAEAGTCGGAVCQFGSLPINAVRTITVTARSSSLLGAGVITNTAAAFSLDAPTITATAPTTLSTAAALNITKAALNTPVNAGGTAFFQVNVTNNGPSMAQAVRVTDTLPSGLTYAGGDAACTANGQTVTCALGALAAGATRSLLIQGNTDAGLADGALLTNAVVAGSPTATQTVSASANVTVRQVGPAQVDLKLVKSGPITATAGQAIRYALTVTNAGPAAAPDVSLVDALPPGVSFIAATASQGLCAAGIACQLGSLPVNGQATVVVTGLVQSDVVTGTLLVNQANVSGAGSELTPADNQAAYTTTVYALALLRISKQAQQATVLAGGAIQYRIVVTNSGPSTAQAVVVSDTLPVVLQSPFVNSSVGGCTQLPCSLGDLPPGAAATILVAGYAAADAVGLVNNTAAVTSTTPLAAASVLMDSAQVTVNPYADLVLRKDAAPTVVAGESIFYTLTLTNNGPSTARFITVTDALPSQATFVAASPGCSQASGVVSCLLSALAPNTTVSYTVQVATAAGIESGTSLENRAIASAVTLDPNPLNNLATADTSIVGRAHLLIAKHDTVDPVLAGATVTYTIAVTNSGPSTARAVDVTDQWPTGMTLESITASDGGQCAGGLCRFGAVPANATRTMTVALRIGSSVPAGVLTNVAAVYSPDSDQPAPTVVTETTTVQTAAALRVTKAALNNPVMAGGSQLYQVTVYNDGPSDAQVVTLADDLPLHTTFAGGDSACTGSGRSITCAVGTLPAKASRALLVQVTVDAATADGVKITNVVTATSPTAAQPVTATAESTVRQPAGGAVDLFVNKTGSLTATAGETLVYTITVGNRGPSAANSVQVVDALPLSLTAIAVSSSQGTCNGSVVCQLGDLPMNATATVIVTGLVNSAALSGTQIVNVAQASSNNVDANPLDNTAQFTTTLDNRAWLTIDKQAQADTVAPGAALSYRIVVANMGPSLARSVVVTDLFPAEFLNPLVSSTRGGCTGNACRLGDLPAGETATILVVGAVSPLATGSFTNRVVMTTTSPLDGRSVLTDAVTTQVGDTADLVMIKNGTLSVYAGQNITYEIKAYNAGPSPANGVQILDQLPLGVTLVSHDPACGEINAQGQIRCPATPTTLAAGATITYSLVVKSDAALATGSVVENRATVESTTPDPNPINNTAQADTTIIGQADIHVTKYADPQSVLAGERLTYTVIVTNIGPSNANTVRLVDVLPAEVVQVAPVAVERSASAAPVVCLNLVCEFGAMPLGEVITLTLPVRVLSGVADRTTFTNTATVYSPSDPDPTDNIGRAPAQALRQSVLVVTKSASPDPAVTGAELVYSIQVANLGPSDAAGVVVNDTLPPGFTTTSVGSSQGNCTALPCTVGDLPAGAAAVVQVRGQVSPIQGGALVNSAFATATSPLTQTERSTTTITTPVTALADLELILQSTPTAIAGLTATVYANVFNHGPSSAVGTLVTVTLPASTTLAATDLPAGWTATPLGNGQVVLQTSNTLIPGAQALLALTVNVDPAVAPGSSLEFAGRVAAQTPDPNPANNTDTADTGILAQADLAVRKSGPAELIAGAQARYVITVQNNGPSAGTVRDIKDSLPPSITLSSATLYAGSGLAACAGAICQLGRPLAVGEAITMEVSGRVDPAAPSGAVLTNTATVFGDGVTPDPDPSNNQAQYSAPVSALAQIAIDKYDLVDPVYPDSLLVYALVITNSGPSAALNLLVTDTLPAGVAFVSSTGDCTANVNTANANTGNGSTVTCAAGQLEAGGRTVFQIIVRVAASAPNGLVLHNVASLSSSTPLTNSILTADEDTRVVVPSGPLADLEVKKTVQPPAVLTGDLVTYTIVVTNNGPSPVNSVQLIDLMPDGLTLVRVRASQGYCNAGISCLLGSLNYIADSAGATTLRGTATVTIVARAATNLVKGDLLVNTAYVQSERQDPVPENNVSEATVAVDSLADLAISKFATPGAILAGQGVQYTLVITNYGPGLAKGAIVTDTLPAGLSWQRADGCVVKDVLAACALGDVPAGALRVLTLWAAANADSTGIFTNTAETASQTPDPNLANNTSQVPIKVAPVIPVADVQIEKADPIGLSTAGGLITYTLRVYNAGPDVAQNVLVQDPLPAALTYVWAQPLPTGGSPQVPLWSLGAMNPGAVQVITLTTHSDAGALAGLLIRNTATVTTTTVDPQPQNNASSAQSQVFGAVDVEVKKTAEPTVVLAGGRVVYTITVTNHGPSAAQSVDVKELLPPSVTLQSLGATRGVCVSQICQFGAMTAGESIVITTAVVVDPALRPGDLLTNTAAAFTDTPDGNPANNIDKAPVIVGPLVNLRISKHSRSVTATVGSEITYTMIVTNYGPSLAPNVVITDKVPQGFIFRRTSNPTGCERADRWYVVCSLGPQAAGEVKATDLVFFIESVHPLSVTNSVYVNDPGAFDPGGGSSGELVLPSDPKGPTAVTLNRFEVVKQDGLLVVVWQTVNERDTWGYRLWRNTVNDRDTAVLVTPQTLPAQGSGATYGYADTTAEPGILYYYWLQEIGLNGALKEIDMTAGGIDIVTGQYLYLPAVQNQSSGE